MKRRLFNLYLFIKKKLKLPIYKVDVLFDVKYNTRFSNNGLCPAIRHSLDRCLNRDEFELYQIEDIFNKLDRNIAIDRFNGIHYHYWWSINDWKGGRMDFLNWLIDQYGFDTTDLRKTI